MIGRAASSALVASRATAAQVARPAAANFAAWNLLQRGARYVSWLPWLRSAQEHAAVMRKLEAEAKTAAARTAATTLQSQVDAEATKLQSRAQANKTDEAERVKLHNRAAAAAADAAVAAAKAASVWRQVLAAALHPGTWILTGILAGAVAIGVDWYMHDYQPYLTSCMKQALREGKLVPPPNNDVIMVPTAGLPTLRGLGRPVLFYGPSGSGKSTYAHKVAWDNVSGQQKWPTALIRFRAHRGDNAATVTYTGSGAGLQSVQDGDFAVTLATLVCEQLQFPTRCSWLSSLASMLVGVAESLPRERMSRAHNAIDTLFEAAHELYNETGQRPLLIFDEPHDLVRSRSVSVIGGENLFKKLGTFAVWYQIERASINFVAVGSSALFIFDWEDTTPLGGARVILAEMTDPPREDVYSALVKRHKGVAYTPQEANQLLDVCGRRVRMLQGALTDRASAASVVSAAQAAASGGIRRLLEEIGTEAKSKLVAVLDDIARADASGSNAGRPTMYDTPFKFALIGRNYPPGALRVLYVDGTCMLRFQSDAVQQAWAAQRHLYSTVGKPA